MIQSPLQVIQPKIEPTPNMILFRNVQEVNWYFIGLKGIMKHFILMV